MTKRITIEFVFEEENEDDEDYAFYELSEVNLVEALTDMDREDRYSISESWAQSDRYWTNTCWDILNEIGS